MPPSTTANNRFFQENSRAMANAKNTSPTMKNARAIQLSRLMPNPCVAVFHIFVFPNRRAEAGDPQAPSHPALASCPPSTARAPATSITRARPAGTAAPASRGFAGPQSPADARLGPWPRSGDRLGRRGCLLEGPHGQLSHHQLGSQRLPGPAGHGAKHRRQGANRADPSALAYPLPRRIWLRLQGHPLAGLPRTRGEFQAPSSGRLAHATVGRGCPGVSK